MAQLMFRICTEDTNREGIAQILDQWFESWSMWPGKGSWKGTRERSLLIEWVVPATELPGVARVKAKQVAREIGYRNKQEAVLVQEIPCTSTFV